MALEKTVAADKIEIVGQFKAVQVRTATVITEDGVELSRSFHRHVIQPGDDVSGESSEVQAIAAAVHTQDIKDAYQAHLDAQSNGEA